jgi:glutamate synthase (NADPH/NADH) small chain
MADPRGFITTPRQVAERRPVHERIHDWKEVYPGTPGRALLPIITEQAGRCMDCGIPFCHTGCPLGNLIPEWNDLVWPPTTSRSSRVGCVRRRVRRPAWSASTGTR